MSEQHSPPQPLQPPLPVDAASWSIWLQYQRLLDDRARHAEQLAAQAEYMAAQRAVVVAMGAQTAAIKSLADAIRAHVTGNGVAT